MMTIKIAIMLESRKSESEKSQVKYPHLCSPDILVISKPCLHQKNLQVGENSASDKIFALCLTWKEISTLLP